jgi:DNA-binding MarR family transcriptional regulator
VNRPTVTAEILEELVAHQPAQAMRYMRKWPGGALSLVHLQVLLALDTEGPLPMRVLSERMDVSQASATGIVDRMEQRGLVERRRDEADRRVVRVELTETGRETIGGFAAERRERLVRILGELTDEELAGFLVGLRGMRRGRELLHERLKAEHEAANPGSPFHDDAPPPIGAPAAPAAHAASAGPEPTTPEPETPQ